MLELGEYDSINFVLIRYYSQNANFPQRYFPKPIKSLSIPFLKVYIILMGSDPWIDNAISLCRLNSAFSINKCFPLLYMGFAPFCISLRTGTFLTFL